MFGQTQFFNTSYGKFFEQLPLLPTRPMYRQTADFQTFGADRDFAKIGCRFFADRYFGKISPISAVFLKIWPDLAEFWPFLAVITFHKGQFLADFENFSFCRFCRFFFELKPIFGKKELATLTITLYVHYPFSMHGANVNLRELESSDFKKAIKIFIQISNHHIM